MCGINSNFLLINLKPYPIFPMTDPSFTITLSLMIEFEIIQFDPIVTLFPITTLPFIRELKPILNFFPISTPLFIKVFFCRYIIIRDIN